MTRYRLPFTVVLASCAAVTWLGTASATGSSSSHSSQPSASARSTDAPPSGTSLGGSIVYILADNVWLAAPDGSGAHQLTTDGTSDQPYREPVQAPDGTILVLHDAGDVDHLARDGEPLASPVPLDTLENGGEGLAVSPDGTLIAYVTTGFGQTIDPRFGTPNGTYIYGGMDVAHLDGTSLEGAAVPSMLYPSWIDASHIAGSNGTDLLIATLDGNATTWLSLEDGCLIPDGCQSALGAAANVTLPVVSTDGQRAAYEYDPFYGDGGRRIARVDGFSTPPTTTCLIPGTGQIPQDPGTFEPDGAGFAWDAETIDQTTFELTPGDGIRVLAIDPTKPDCGAATAPLSLPRGVQPDWGPLAP